MDALALFTPPDMTLPAALAIVAISFATAALTAAIGIGGGLALLAAMSALMPAGAVVPVHGVAQMGANASRFFFLRQHVEWRIIAWFAIGAAIGGAIGGRVVVVLPEQALRFGVALFILATVWAPKPTGLNAGPRTFFGAGVIGTFLTMFFGATGPIVAAALSTTKLDRMRTVGTHAAAMTVQHGVKSLAFGVYGFLFADWVPLICAILAAGFAGSYAGARILKATPEGDFQRWFRLALTVAALALLATAFR